MAKELFIYYKLILKFYIKVVHSYENKKSPAYRHTKLNRIEKREILYFLPKKFTDKPIIIVEIVNVIISIEGYARSKNILSGASDANVLFTTKSKK